MFEFIGATTCLLAFCYLLAHGGAYISNEFAEWRSIKDYQLDAGHVGAVCGAFTGVWIAMLVAVIMYTRGAV